MRDPHPWLATAMGLLLLGACSSGSSTADPITGTPVASSPASGTVSPTTPSPAPSTAEAAAPSMSVPSTSASSAQGAPAGVVGTVVRFSARGAEVDVTIDQDTPATRDFLSMLPLTVDLSDLSGREKIAYLPWELDVQDTPGSDPEDGHLIYFTPWGNLGFYYDATGVDHSDLTLHLGTFTATREQLDRIEGGQVDIAAMD